MLETIFGHRQFFDCEPRLYARLHFHHVGFPRGWEVGGVGGTEVLLDDAAVVLRQRGGGAGDGGLCGDGDAGTPRGCGICSVRCGSGM